MIRICRVQKKRFLSTLALVYLSLFMAKSQAQSPKGEVTIYCSALAQWCEVMRQDFEIKTGIKTLMTVKSAGETLAQLKAEAGNPRADLWWAGGGDQHLQAAELGLTEPYRSPLLNQLHPWAQKQAEQAQWRTVGIYAGTLGIVWNSEALGKRKLLEHPMLL